MNHVDSTWTTPDNLSLFTKEWKPAQEPRAVVVLIHGLGEHIGRYEHWAENFNQQGIAVMGFDQRGHGKSQGKRGHSSYADTMKDIRHFLEEAAHKYPGLPIFLYGHSLGGSLVLYYGFTQETTISGRPLAGIIATSPGLRPAQPVGGAKMMLARLMARIAPDFTMANGLDRSGLSRTAQVIERYNQDPLVHGMISARLGLDIIEKGEWMLAQKTFPLPLLLLHGSADRVVSPDACREFGNSLALAECYKAFEGGYHEMHNEAEQKDVFGFILKWINRMAV